jgi:FkbM family methyltransferase
MAVARRKAPRTITVRTPIGRLEIALRNFPSLRFVFSIFCRGDYQTPTDRPYSFIDIGANVGVAALYFLSRHPANEVICFEPDDENFGYLERNLAPFASRATLVKKGVSVAEGEAQFFRSAYGDLSSLATIASPVASTRIETVSFRSLLARSASERFETIVKLDVEGMEEQLVASVDFADFPRVKRMFCDSTQCSALITRPHRRNVRSGYVEEICFTDG